LALESAEVNKVSCLSSGDPDAIERPILGRPCQCNGRASAKVICSGDIFPSDADPIAHGDRLAGNAAWM